MYLNTVKNNPVLEILVGPIASGKSTYCRQKAKEGYIIVNDDAIITFLHGGEYKLYNEDLKPLYKIVENTIITTALAMKINVVIDRPNHSRVMRRRYISLAKSLDISVIIIMMRREASEVHAKRRMTDSRGYTYEYWLKTIKEHELLYDEPKYTEGFDNVVEWKFEKKSDKN